MPVAKCGSFPNATEKIALINMKSHQNSVTNVSSFIVISFLKTAILLRKPPKHPHPPPASKDASCDAVPSPVRSTVNENAWVVEGTTHPLVVFHGI